MVRRVGYINYNHEHDHDHDIDQDYITPPETDVAPWCYKWIGYGMGLGRKSPRGAMLRAPMVLI